MFAAAGRPQFHAKENQQTGSMQRNAFKTSDGKERANTGFVVSVITEDDALANVWIADSRATSHMTNRKEWFETLTLLDDGPLVSSAGREQVMQVNGIGRIKINIQDGAEVTSAYLNDVWYIPAVADLNLSVVEADMPYGCPSTLIAYPLTCNPRSGTFCSVFPHPLPALLSFLSFVCISRTAGTPINPTTRTMSSASVTVVAAGKGEIASFVHFPARAAVKQPDPLLPAPAGR